MTPVEFVPRTPRSSDHSGILEGDIPDHPQSLHCLGPKGSQDPHPPSEGNRKKWNQKPQPRTSEAAHSHHTPEKDEGSLIPWITLPKARPPARRARCSRNPPAWALSSPRPTGPLWPKPSVPGPSRPSPAGRAPPNARR